MKKILVISPHPDDEAIGCGGTLLNHYNDGDFIRIIFLTSGEMGKIDKKTERQVAIIREKEAKNATKILGAKKIEFWHYPDGNLKMDKSIILRLKRSIEEMQPDILYVTSDKESHPDHHEAAKIVKESLLKTKIKPEVLMFEVWTTIQKFNIVNDISKVIKIKTKAIRAYKSQCKLIKYDEAAIALDRYRGEMHSWPNGGDYAEIFQKMKFK